MKIRLREKMDRNTNDVVRLAHSDAGTLIRPRCFR
jgi:hypothetical protein